MNQRVQRPIPTNHWCIHLLKDRFSGDLWTYPLMVNCNENGTKIYQPKKWNSAGTDLIQDFPLDLGAQDFKIDRAIAWDWTVTARLVESRTKHMDLTLMKPKILDLSYPTPRGNSLAKVEKESRPIIIRPTQTGSVQTKLFHFTLKPLTKSGKVGLMAKTP